MKIFKIQNLCGVAHFSFVCFFFSLFLFRVPHPLEIYTYIGPIAKGNFVIAVCKRVTCNRPPIPDYTHGRWIVDTGCTHDNRLSNFICRMNISPSTVNGKCFDGFNIFVGDSISEIHTHTHTHRHIYIQTFWERELGGGIARVHMLREKLMRVYDFWAAQFYIYICIKLLSSITIYFYVCVHKLALFVKRRGGGGPKTIWQIFPTLYFSVEILGWIIWWTQNTDTKKKRTEQRPALSQCFYLITKII